MIKVTTYQLLTAWLKPDEKKMAEDAWHTGVLTQHGGNVSSRICLIKFLQSVSKSPPSSSCKSTRWNLSEEDGSLMQKKEASAVSSLLFCSSNMVRITNCFLCLANFGRYDYIQTLLHIAYSSKIE